MIDLIRNAHHAHGAIIHIKIPKSAIPIPLTASSKDTGTREPFLLYFGQITFQKALSN